MNQFEPNLTDDTLLLQQVEQDSKQAFNILFKKYWERTFSGAYKLVKEYDASKDIVQEVFTNIWVNRHKLHIENFPAYVNSAMRKRSITYLAKQKLTHSFYSIAGNFTEKNIQADANLLWKDFFQSYEALLKTLPPKRQMIFRLRYQEDLSTKAIALQMGITRKTVQNQLGKAIETLKVSLLRIITLTILLLTATS